MKILFIEDDPDFAGMFERMVAHCGLSITAYVVCPTMSESMTHLAIVHIAMVPDIIILDLNLLDTRGMDTIAHIPALDAVAPVVIMSGLGLSDIDSVLLAACYSAGAVGHIFKRHVNMSSVHAIAGLLVGAGYNWRRIHGK